MYGTGQEEGKQNGESICVGLESGACEIPVKEHVYELTSGYTYDVPNKVTYSTQGPREEMVISLIIIIIMCTSIGLLGCKHL